MKQHLNSLIRHDKRFPGMGTLYAVDNSSLQGLRKWAIKGFKKYLIFYLDQEDFITIVRILYTAQDMKKLLALRTSKI
ncbi:MAG: hypothetical protein KME60_11480 [Cyanomargarita calcarea GSE-NOS-MK-12-04C]|jgi:toxin ParE1/3/4|uniref:Type II toxin-antitoxin system RelE/ParE family toxin n=1 Tax=Cyanomargarita calcarea GSE-NOS-MK-12-04C TaxID=2839659 RepID=A0A951QKH3_9CYAN|nr:hypothetical protein [Cyanomargarita calcarea GSE-NOS-MK-12-04C]